MSISETNLGYTLQAQPLLRQRIEAIVRNAMWDGTGDPTRDITKLVDALAWAVASHDPIRKTIRDWWEGDGKAFADNVSRSVDAIDDSQLLTVVTTALTRLKFTV